MSAECGYSPKCLGYIWSQPTAIQSFTNKSRGCVIVAGEKIGMEKAGLILVYIMSNELTWLECIVACVWIYNTVYVGWGGCMVTLIGDLEVGLRQAAGITNKIMTNTSPIGINHLELTQTFFSFVFFIQVFYYFFCRSTFIVKMHVRI